MKHVERGATLSQVMITLAVISTLSGVGMHHMMQWLPSYRLGSAARGLLVNIQRAKLQAIHRRTVCYLDFDFDGNGSLESGPCILWEDRNDNHRKERLEKGETFFDLSLPPGVCLGAYPCELGGPRRGPNNTKVDAGGGDGVTFNFNRIKFNPNGTCTAGTIYVHSSRGRTFAIRLRSNGIIQLWHHDGGTWQR